MADSPRVLSEVDDRGIVTLSLNRPKVGNAYDAALIAALDRALTQAAADARVRAVVLRGLGKHFQAGADVRALRALAERSEADNQAFSRMTVEAMRKLADLPKPTLALVHGACFGGGIGLLASCDMAIASEDAFFSLSEVHIGIPPAPIAPQLVASMGLRAALFYSLTGKRFGAREAQRIGLVSETCPPGSLDEAAAEVIDGLLRAGPRALYETKSILRKVARVAVDDALAGELAALATTCRRSDEAREGFAGFAERRSPAWYTVPKTP
ncbi:MAG TPA: enoyl-CoA hydratase-related protein [Geminicoccaceae bacterium]|nr:enoyl-CoA hydratase-related protein [Geminicoccaceae bacterium]